MTETKYLNPESIALDAGTQSRVKTNENVIQQYAEKITEGYWDFEKDPPVVFNDGDNYYPGSGHHRIAAAKLAGGEILCEVREGGLQQAIRFSCYENTQHGLQRNNADKRRAVEMLFGSLLEEFGAFNKIPDEFSDRAIARDLEVSNKFVGNVRKEIKRELDFSKKKFKIGSRVEIKATKVLGKIIDFDKKRGVHFLADLHAEGIWLEPEELKNSRAPVPEIIEGGSLSEGVNGSHSPGAGKGEEQDLDDAPVEDELVKPKPETESTPEPVLEPEAESEPSQLATSQICGLVETNSNQFSEEECERIAKAIAPILSQEKAKKIWNIGRRKKTAA